MNTPQACYQRIESVANLGLERGLGGPPAVGCGARFVRVAVQAAFHFAFA